jgi:hypothetical protein
MNKRPKGWGTQRLFIYTGIDGGGCRDMATIVFHDDVRLYAAHQIDEMLIQERVSFIPYLLSVLVVLGHDPVKET